MAGLRIKHTYRLFVKLLLLVSQLIIIMMWHLVKLQGLQ